MWKKQPFISVQGNTKFVMVRYLAGGNDIEGGGVQNDEKLLYEINE